MSLQLLATKTEIPRCRHYLVARPRLLHRLDDSMAAGCRLCLVSAPAGYGKTTVLADWLAHLLAAQPDAGASLPLAHAAWLTLDAGDNDPVRFLGYLCAALQLVDPDLAGSLAATFSAADAPVWQSVLPALVNAVTLFPGAVLLVLDDYHCIAAQSVHDLVAGLLDFGPPNLYLVIATRSDPPLPLARLRSCGALTELRQHDLRFSLPEADEFLTRTLSCTLAASNVAALTSRTEGWIAGLQMAAVSLRGRTAAADVTAFVEAFTGSHRHVLDYLAEEVYRCQPPAVRDFLLRTSVLERFCAPLCAAVTDGDAVLAQEILEQLEHTNLFVVPLDDERRWYRYHHLFAELLRNLLDRQQPQAVLAQHLAASRWFEQEQFLYEAIDHALAGGSYDHAAQLIETAVESVMMAGEVASLRRWLEALPAPTLRSHPILCLYEAAVLLLAGEPVDRVEQQMRADLLPFVDDSAAGLDPLDGPMVAFASLQAILQKHPNQSALLAHTALAILPERSPFFRSLASLILAFDAIFVGDDELAVRRLQQALAVSDLAGNSMNSVLARCHLAEFCVLRNCFGDAETLYQEAFAVAGGPASPRPIGGVPLLGLGVIQYERNDLASALRLLEQGIDLVQNWGKFGVVQGYVVLAKVRLALGDVAGAAALRHQVAGILARGSVPPVMLGPHALFDDVYCALQADDLAQADRLALAAGVPFEETLVALNPPLPLDRCYQALLQSRLLAAHGRCRTALEILNQLSVDASEQGRDHLVLEVRLAQALVYRRLNRWEAALDAFAAALSLAAVSGCVRSFVDAGEPAAELLRLALRHGLYPELGAHLLAAITAEMPADEPPATAPRAGADGAAVILSPRELQVLDLVDQGLTNEEIAQRLVVALSTVKTHLNHICVKLDARNRMAAAAKARHLGLLAER